MRQIKIKIRMKNNILFLLFAISFMACTNTDPSSNEPVQKESPIIQSLKTVGDMRGDMNLFKTTPKGYVAVVAPTLVDQNIFDLSLHTAGVYTYLENEKDGGVETILISQENQETFESFIKIFEKERAELYPKLTFINDTTGQLVKVLGVNPEHLDHAGEAVALDKEGKKLFSLDEYRCQGEKLQRLHQTYFPRTIEAFAAPSYEIKQGEKLPVELTKYVENHLGKENVMITFYPSPLSHACSIQMDDFTHFSEKKNLKMFGVSIGTDEQVEAWKMNQYVGLELLADSTGMISNDFNSLLREDDGIVYSDRTVFIIDKNGIVQYINKDYDVVADLSNLEKAILALSE